MLRFSICALCLPLWALQAPVRQPAQSASSDWRRILEDVPSQPAPNTSARDVERVRGALQAGAPYMLSGNPADYEANREMVRRVVAYLAAVELLARDPAMRLAIGRAYSDLGDLQAGRNGTSFGNRDAALSSYRRAGAVFGDLSRGRTNERQLERDLEVLGTRMAILGAPLPLLNQPSPPPAAPRNSPQAESAEPPFTLRPPVAEGVPASQRAEMEQLRERYVNAAGNAVAAWQNAESLRRNLAAEGMSLNNALAAALSRMQLYLQLAASSLENREWADARQNLERAEYQTEKVLKSIGR